MNDSDPDRNQIVFTGAGTLNLGGSISGGTITAPTGTVNYNGGSAQSVANYAYFNLTLSGAGAKTLGGNRTITGNLLIEAGATLTLGGNDLDIDVDANRSATVNGTLNINGNGRLTETQGSTKTLVLGSGGYLSITDNGGSTLPALNAYSFDANSTVEYGSTDDQTIENSATYGHLITSGSGTKTLEGSGGTMTFLGNVTIGSGTTLASNNKTMNVAGNWVNNGTFTQGTSTVNFNGSSLQTLSGSTATTFNSMTVNNAAGLSLSTSQTVSGTLTLTSGLITTNANSLTVGASGTITGASSARYINGNLCRVYSATGSKDFPIGKGGNYRLTTLNYTALTGTSTVCAEQIESTLPGTLPANTSVQSGRYWVITQTGGSGFTYTLTLDGSSFTPGADDPVILKGDGSSNTAFTATFSSPNFTATGLTSFSNFAVGATAKNCPVSTAVAPSANQTVCQGVATNQLTATITTSGGTGNPTLQYQWYYNTTNSNTVAGATLIVGATSQTYTPLSGSPEVGTRYYFCVGYATNNGCGQTNADQSLASNTVMVTVNATPTNTTITPSPSPVCQNATLNLSVTAVGGSSYNWAGNGIVNTNSNATTAVPTATGSQTYTVTVTNSNSCTATGTVAVVVNAAPTAGTCNLVGDPCYANIGSVKVEASGGTPPYTLSWTPAHGTPTSPQTLNNSGDMIMISGLTGGQNYIFTVIDSNGCQAP